MLYGFALSLPLFLLIGPALYFYVRGILTNEYDINKKNWFHFLPFIGSMLMIIPFLMEEVEVKQRYIQFLLSNDVTGAESLSIPFFYIRAYFILKALLAFAYALYCFFWFRKEFQSQLISFNQSALTWLKFFLVINVVGNFLPLIFTINRIFLIVPIQPKLAGFTAILFLGFVINISIFMFPHVLYGTYLKKTKKNLFEPVKESPPEEIEIKELDKLLKQYLLTNPFLDQSFSKAKVLVDLDVPDKLLIFYFNEYLQISFNQWKTNLRVEHSANLIEEGFLKTRTIESLAIAVGFKSRSRFSEAFKKRFGLFPSEYGLD